jgi:hypothetical protein
MLAAALFLKRAPSRTYHITVWTLLRSPWSMMDFCETPAAETAVAGPAFRECPEYLYTTRFRMRYCSSRRRACG